MKSQNISSLAMNFRKSLEVPGDKPVMYEEDVIFDAQEFNRILLASVRVSGTQANKIEVRTIDEQKRVAELVTNKQIKEMIYNEEQGKNATEGVRTRSS